PSRLTMSPRSQLSRSQLAQVMMLILLVMLPLRPNRGLGGDIAILILVSFFAFIVFLDKDDWLLTAVQQRRLASNCSTCAHPAVTVCKVCGTPFCPDHGRATSMVCANHVARARADTRRQWLWGIGAFVLLIAAIEICVQLLSSLP